MPIVQAVIRADSLLGDSRDLYFGGSRPEVRTVGVQRDRDATPFRPSTEPKKIPHASWRPFDPCSRSRMSRFATTLRGAKLSDEAYEFLILFYAFEFAMPKSVIIGRV
jgi:hypothetical protein